MYWNILKRDLKRKKTMNVILLLFAVIASMFVSSGLSNVVNVMNGTEHYLDLAGIGDYVIITQNTEGGAEEILRDSENAEKYRTDYCYWGTIEKNVKIKGKTLKSKNDATLFQKLNENGCTLFKTDNTKLEKVNTGEVYITGTLLNNNEIEAGDEVYIEFGNLKKSYRIAGGIKDALLGSDMMGNTRVIFSDEDFKDFETEENKPFKGAVYCIDTNDEKALAGELSDCQGILFTGSRSLIKITYVMEMLVAMIVLVLSVCLCIVSFVLLKFVITFTINEEFREIGVMKAIGFRNSSIIRWQVYRFMIIAGASEILAVIFTYPVTKLWCDPIWSMMGASDVDYCFSPVSLLVVYPGIILMITLAAVLITAGITKKITSNDVGNVE